MATEGRLRDENINPATNMGSKGAIVKEIKRNPLQPVNRIISTDSTKAGSDGKAGSADLADVDFSPMGPPKHTRQHHEHSGVKRSAPTRQPTEQVASPAIQKRPRLGCSKTQPSQLFFRPSVRPLDCLDDAAAPALLCASSIRMCAMRWS